ncbi:glycosyltransferase [Microbacteriaceae bacterium VKM Ac-2855]|nr:glycosyltransferase [Microbacteriaceae bacterium VKM Ac-2855]
MTAPLNIVLIGPARHPIRQPHAGGLESAVWNEVRMLRRLGHRVRLIAVAGSDFLDEDAAEFTLPPARWAAEEAAAENDTDYPAGHLDRASIALDRALDKVADEAGRLDVIANHSLHPLPLLRAGELGTPMLTTLHTPVLLELVAADAACIGERSAFVAVSEHTRAQWAAVGIESTVLPNGVDVDDWPLGAGGSGELIWFGRLVPEKGAHLAIEVARMLGRPLTLIGRVGDPAYAERSVFPLLGDGIRHLGALDQPRLAAAVGRSSVAMITPVWAEPFGLVVPEALLCGTPVAAFDVGGIAEIARTTSGVETAPVGDVTALAAVVERMLDRPDPLARGRIRTEAARHYSLGQRTRRLETMFRASAARLSLA